MQNRVIKFRVWDKKAGYFIIPYQITPFRNANYNDIDLTYSNSGRWYISGGNELTEDRYTVQQFTGLKDKNGKDIYEGDILLLPRYGALTDSFLIVEWGMNSGCCNNAAMSGLCVPDDSQDSEIVGNNFENPDLLK